MAGEQVGKLAIWHPNGDVLRRGNLARALGMVGIGDAEKQECIVWLGDVDSNHDKQSQSLLSYR